MDVCKCRNPFPEKFEFELLSKKDNEKMVQTFQEHYNTEPLKEKTICDLMHILDQLECGIQPNLEILLEEISLINIYG